MDQSLFTEQIIKRFRMDTATPAHTPLDPNQDLSVLEHNEEGPNSPGTNFPYQEAVGSILYLSQTTRPDLCYAACTLSRYTKNPQKIHINAVKRTLRYLIGARKFGLRYDSNDNSGLVGFADSDYANDMADRKSISGYIFLYNGTPVSWTSKKQKTIAMSTCNAEYVSLSLACQEALWLRNLLSEINPDLVPEATKIYVDNKAAIDLAKTTAYKPRSKHIDVRHHFIRDCIERKLIDLEHVSSSSMLADFLTKPLTRELFNSCVQGANISEI